MDSYFAGDFTQDFFQLRTSTEIKEATVALAGIPYLNRTKIRLKADVDIDSKNKKFTLLPGKLVSVMVISNIELPEFFDCSMPAESQSSEFIRRLNL